MRSLTAMRSILKHILLVNLVLGSYLATASDSLLLAQAKQILVVSADNKGNLFVADEANSLIKLDSNGKEVTRVNTKVYGKIYSIDCSNPFEIYVYYKQQNVLVFFDNMLNIRGEMRFNDLGYDNISCVARSFDNQVWLFDYNDYELKKVRKDGSMELSSGNILTFSGNGFNPMEIYEHNKTVMLLDSSFGLMSFDIFGTYLKTIPAKGASSVYFYGNRMYMLKPINSNNREIWSYHLKSLEYTLKETINDVTPVICGFKHKLYLHKNNIIYIR